MWNYKYNLKNKKNTTLSGTVPKYKNHRSKISILTHMSDHSLSWLGTRFWTCFILGLTGVLLVTIICIIYVFATQTARRFIFNGFWLTHKLIVVMYVLMIVHGASWIVQKPLFFAYFIGPAILFAMDKMVSLSRKKSEIIVLRAEKLPSGKSIQII